MSAEPTTLRRQRALSMATDLVSVLAGWFIFSIIRFGSLPPSYYLLEGGLWGWLSLPTLLIGDAVIPLCMVLLYSVSGVYNDENLFATSRLDALLNTVGVSFIGMLGIYFIALMNDSIPERMANYELLACLLACLVIPTYISRLVLIRRTNGMRARGFMRSNVLVAGGSPKSAAKIRRLVKSSASTSMDFVGIVDIDNAYGDCRYIDSLPVYDAASLPELIKEHGIEALVVLPSSKGLAANSENIARLYPLGLSLYVTPDLYGLLTLKPRLSAVRPEPIINITSANIPAHVRNLKRLGDIFFSALALIVLAPVYAAVAVAVKTDSPGPVFYTQERIGYNRKPFRIIKFRTMRPDAESGGPQLTGEDDSRVTRLGHWLRKYRIDEIPQFWNVLRGDMSLVGPRPERQYFIDMIAARNPAYALIHQVRPGITSWGMVKFGYANTVDQMVERLGYDLLYLENVSLSVDLKILLHTVNTVITGRGL